MEEADSPGKKKSSPAENGPSDRSVDSGGTTFTHDSCTKAEMKLEEADSPGKKKSSPAEGGLSDHT